MSYLEIIFQNRNRDYGAYELRYNYPGRLYKALLITLIFATVVTLLSFAKSDKNQPLINNVSDIVLDPIDKTKETPLEPPKKEEIKKQEIQSVKYMIPIIKPDEEVVESLPDQEDIEMSKIGNESTKGEIDSGLTIVPTEGMEKGVIEEKPKEEVIFTSVEIPASFPGGFDKWKRYLERNLKADIPIDNGAPSGSYKVMIQFIVDPIGNISAIVPLTQFGYGLEEEAIRVIKSGPKWNPAIQNGNQVKAYCTQIVTFVVEGQ